MKLQDEKIKRMIQKGYSDRRIAKTLKVTRKDVQLVRETIFADEGALSDIPVVESFQFDSPTIYQPTGVKEAIKTRLDSSLKSKCHKCGFSDSQGDEYTSCAICGKYYCFDCWYDNTSGGGECPSGCDSNDHCLKCEASKAENFLDPDVYHCFLHNKTIIDPLLEVCPDYIAKEHDPF